MEIKNNTPTKNGPIFNVADIGSSVVLMIASLYILTLKIENQDETPLLSVRDARLLAIAIAFATPKEVDICLEHIRIRHQQRQADIDRHYK